MNNENKITYESFAERVAQRANISDAEADRYIHQLSKTVGEALETGDEVQLYQFGRFTTNHFDERPGHNPQTGETITIQEHTRVDFHPYKALLRAVNWPFRNLRTRMLPEKDSDERSSPITWLILVLALLALVLVGFYVNSRIANQNSANTPAADSVANVEPIPTTASAVPAATRPDADSGLPVQSVESSNNIVAIDPPIQSSAAMNFSVATDPFMAVIETTAIVVVQGQTLWGIAEAQWGDSSWWPVLYAENRVDLPERNPDLIETGISLRIPVLEGRAAQPTDDDLRQKTKGYRIVSDDYEQLGDIRAAEYQLVGDRGF